MPLDLTKIRNDFAILKRQISGKPLVFLDNAATTQKPQSVVDSIVRYYSTYNSNVGRGVYALSTEAYEAYEHARVTVQQFINARKAHEVIFTKGTTESINLVASSFARRVLGPGDEVIVTALEHHANLIPWQQVCKEKGARMRVIPLNERGEVELEAFQALLSERTKLVAVAHISNVLGTLVPVKAIIQQSHQRNVPVLIDGAQAIAHEKVDVQDLDCDFYAFSSHKVYGPMGMGVLYGKEKWLEEMPPYQTGGGIAMDANYDEMVALRNLPFRHEAGTPNVEGAVGLEAALQYLTQNGREAITAYEHELLRYATEKLQAIPDIQLVGTAREKSGIISFNRAGYHPYDLGNAANQQGIAMRTGVHCAIPLTNLLGLVGTVRASFAIYNTKEEIDLMCEVVAQAPKGYWTLERPRDRF
jgi:cysteine desulfurase/selenocysteine lyase